MGQQAGCSYIMTLLQAKSKNNFPIGDLNKKIDPFNIILSVMAQFDIMCSAVFTSSKLSEKPQFRC